MRGSLNGILALIIAVTASPAMAQGPAYDDMPAAPSRAEASTTTAEAQVIRELGRLERLKTQLVGHLDTHSFPDPADPRIRYHKIKAAAPWAEVNAACKAYTEGMTELVSTLEGHPAALRARATELVRWGRGKIVYQVAGPAGINTREAKLLAVDFAPELLRVPPNPKAKP